MNKSNKSKIKIVMVVGILLVSMIMPMGISGRITICPEWICSPTPDPIPTPPPDTTAPSLSITNPKAGDRVSGMVTITASASDSGEGMHYVKFLVNGVQLGDRDYSAPYARSWNTDTYPVGSHSIKVQAYDKAGNVRTKSITVYKDNTAPQVSIISPGSGSVVIDQLRVEASAFDGETGIDRVVFKLDDYLSGAPTVTDRTAPYVGYFFQFTVGYHDVIVTAYDKAGNSKEVRRTFEFRKYVPNDPEYSNQYNGVKKVDMEYMWQLNTEVSNTVICFIEQAGFNYDHEDLKDNYLGGRDLDGAYDDVTPEVIGPDDYHGSHVAGIAAAGVDNNLGISGMANVGFYYVKLNTNYKNSITPALQWCAAQPNADQKLIISMSIAFPEEPTASNEISAIHQNNENILFIAAAGDRPKGETSYVEWPASHENVMAVGCIDTSAISDCDFGTSTSSTGDELELVAPGLNILTTSKIDGEYQRASGTSMSAPMVAGFAALIWEQLPNYTGEDVRKFLRDNAKDYGIAGFDSTFGHGMINGKLAYEALQRISMNSFTQPVDLSQPFEPVKNSSFAKSMDDVNSINSLRFATLALPQYNIKSYLTKL